MSDCIHFTMLQWMEIRTQLTLFIKSAENNVLTLPGVIKLRLSE